MSEYYGRNFEVIFLLEKFFLRNALLSFLPISWDYTNSGEDTAYLWLFYSCSVMSDYLWPHGLQHARLPCPSPSPRACYSYPLSWWCYPLSWWCHLIPCGPLLLLPSIFPRIRVFFNESGSQSIGASASGSVLPMNIQSWFPLLTGLISL